jgi:hypothetical protein
MSCAANVREHGGRFAIPENDSTCKTSDNLLRIFGEKMNYDLQVFTICLMVALRHFGASERGYPSRATGLKGWYKSLKRRQRRKSAAHPSKRLFINRG